MPHHVIIGGGPAATNAIEAIRQVDPNAGPITLVSDEPAHSRMALPYWISGKIPREHTYTGDAAYFERLGTETRFGQRVAGVDSAAKQVTLDDGGTISYDQLLIAVGSSPLRPDIPGADLPGVQPLWNLSQTDQLLQSADGIERPRVVLVGAGFIGFIVLNAMYKRGWDLTVVERERQVLPRMLDGTAATMVQKWLASREVAVHCEDSVQEIRAAGEAKEVVLASGKTIPADIVILATGIQPNTEFLTGSGVEIDQGILVNDQMRTNVGGIYAAGDVAQGPVLFSDQRAIHAIQTTAVDHGRVAGANMAGREVHYPGSLLMNIVDICGLQGSSFGNWDDDRAEPMTIDNSSGFVYRKLLWTDDQITGAIFIGRANDMGMLTDIGMVKGIMQTQAKLGNWKNYLRDNPFDIRRAYIGAGVAQKLLPATLLGEPSKPRDYQYGNVPRTTSVGSAHAAYVGTKEA
jgi:NAD(P)H-nitrite reductase large subunit